LRFNPRQPGVKWAVALIVLSAMVAATPIHWPLPDFAEYWAAGRLMNAGGNPYDAGAMLREQTEIGLKQPQPIMMYNPPWTLVLAMPAARLTFRLARSIWLPLQILIVLWCASRLWVLYGGAPRHAIRASYLGLLWMPTIIALNLGQVSPVVLLGLVGFLWSLDNRRDVAAGACLSLTAVKPQIVALVWVALVLWVIANRRWRVLAGAAACIAGASLAVAWINPNVFVQYRHLMATAPPTLEFESPNLATVLRVMIAPDRSWPQFIPTCVGVVGVALLWYRRRRTWEWSREFPALVLFSCLLTAYGGWAFDLVVLLIPIIATAATVVRSGRTSLVVCGESAFLAVSLVAYVMHQALIPQAGFVWMTPAVLVLSAALVRAAGGAAAQEAWVVQRRVAAPAAIRTPRG
jgi:hypothetical protein